MYKWVSEQTGAIAEQTVILDLAKRGWAAYRSDRDADHDIVVDLGNQKFTTIQVKSMSGNSIAKVIDRSGSKVSNGGKARNSHCYATMGIPWLAGVNRDGHIFYYKLDTYKLIESKSFSVKKYPQDDFPINHNVKHHLLRKGQ